MKQIFRRVKDKEGKIVIENIPTSAIRKDTISIANAYSLISTGTEAHTVGTSIGKLTFQAKKDRQLREQIRRVISAEGVKRTINRVLDEFNKLRPLGYSGAGIVIDVGSNVKGIRLGDKVAYAGAGHAEIVNVSSKLCVKVPLGVELKEAAFVALGSIAIQSIRRAEVQFGEIVVVIGLGLVGQLVSQILQAAGIEVIGIDIIKERVELATKLGLHKGIIAGIGDPVKEVWRYTNKIGADAIIICASGRSSKPTHQAMEMARKKGKVVVVGNVGMNLLRHPFYEKELDFVISTSYGPGRYDKQYEEAGYDYPISYVRWTENRNMQEFISLVAQKKIKIKPLITDIFPLEEAQKAYDLIKSPRMNTLGVLLEYRKFKEAKIEKKIFFKKEPMERKEKINIAVIGCGSFTRATHLPNLERISDYNLKAIVTATGSSATEVAKKYHPEYATTDYKEVLADKNVDLVLISTRHNLHASISIEAAEAGKNIFAEKPMALIYEDCQKIAKAIEKNEVIYTIGFNRRYSSLAIKAKELIKERPLMINYVVNSRKLPPGHWVKDPVEGGGRMIGEACHFFDLIYWFIGAEPVEIFAKSISSKGESLITESNFIVEESFQDGSLASLTYTDLGHRSFPKERIEIFSGGKVIILEDFKKLSINGPKRKNYKLRRPDKGHFTELKEYARVLKGMSPLSVTVVDALRASACTFKALESLRTKKPNTF